MQRQALNAQLGAARADLALERRKVEALDKVRRLLAGEGGETAPDGGGKVGR
jgi:hypothetical protein